MNGTELEVQAPTLSAAHLRDNIRLIQEVMRGTMQEGVHYGTIPGCGNKPTLFKPGAEKIMATFRIACEIETIDLSTTDEARYRVFARATSPSGQFLGTGVGEASTNEKKYRWRACVSEDEWNATPEERRNILYREKSQTRQVRTNHADQANTVLKMAAKRARVDMVLTVTAASDIFTQDLEPDDDGNGTPPIQPPQRKPDTEVPANAITDPQCKRLYAIWKGAGKQDEDVKGYLLEHYGLTSTKQIEKGPMYEEICAWAESPK